MMNIGKFCTVFLCLLIAGTAKTSAVPAYPYLVEHTQSDGTKLSVRIVGDEFFHYVLSSEGYTLTTGADGDFYYATLSTEGQLIPTGVKARPLARLTPAERRQVSALVKGVKPVLTTAVRQRIAASRPAPSPARADGMPTPPRRISESQTTGKLRSLVLLVEFADKSFTTPSVKQAFENLLMQDGYSQNGASGSAWNYYQDNSNQRFDPEFVVVGPYTAAHNSAYYAGYGGTSNVQTLIAEVCRLADDDVDFSQFADDGIIRDVFVFYSGLNQAETGDTSTIWPHRSAVYNQYVSLDGAQLYGYACSSELNSRAQFTAIGTFCHEFGHVLGWPDFYDTDYSGSGGEAPALENYSLMCSGSYNDGSRTPPAINILERWMMGWAEPEEITGPGTSLLDPLWKDKGYLVRTPTENDYFLFESRLMDNFKWDEPLRSGTENSKGLLVYHVDYSSSRQQLWDYNTLNNNPSHECMRMIYSGQNSSGPEYFYPGANNVTQLTPQSNRIYSAWNKSEPNVSFNAISLQGEQVKLVVRGEAPELNLQIQPNQCDALLKWDEMEVESWKVEWKAAGAAQWLGIKNVTSAVCHLEGLAPATKYEVDITPIGGDLFEQAQSFSFTTGSLDTSRKPHLALSEEYTAGEPFVLSIADCSEINYVKWYANGTPVTSYQPFEAGEYCITALIVTKKGAKQYLIKYITVK